MSWESSKLIWNAHYNQFIIQLAEVYYTKICISRDGVPIYQFPSGAHSCQAVGNIWTLPGLSCPRRGSSVTHAFLYWSDPFHGSASALHTAENTQVFCRQLYQVQGSNIQSRHLNFCRPSSFSLISQNRRKEVPCLPIDYSVHRWVLTAQERWVCMVQLPLGGSRRSRPATSATGTGTVTATGGAHSFP